MRLGAKISTHKDGVITLHKATLPIPLKFPEEHKKAKASRRK